MRLARLLVLLLAVAVLAACARQPPRQYVAQPMVRSDLDAMTYGAPATYYRPPPAAYLPVPAPSRTMRYATPYMPVRAMPVVADGPYTLDTGDKLRIVVFGQDTLSNTYTVDA